MKFIFVKDLVNFFSYPKHTHKCLLKNNINFKSYYIYFLKIIKLNCGKIDFLFCKFL